MQNTKSSELRFYTFANLAVWMVTLLLALAVFSATLAKATSANIEKPSKVLTRK